MQGLFPIALEIQKQVTIFFKYFSMKTCCGHSLELFETILTSIQIYVSTPHLTRAMDSVKDFNNIFCIFHRAVATGPQHRCNLLLSRNLSTHSTDLSRMAPANKCKLAAKLAG